MHPLPSPMLLSYSLPAFVAAGAGATTVSIPVSATDAEIGDLLVIYSPYGNFTPGGTGWTHVTATYNTSYEWHLYWKQISSTADVTMSAGDAYGHNWAIYRNAKTLVQNATVSAATDITLGAISQGSGAAIVIFASSQTNGVQPASAAAGFTNRVHANPQPLFDMDLLDSLPNPAGPGLVSLSEYTTNGSTSITAFEIYP